MSNGKNKRWAKNTDVTERLIDGEAVLLNLKNGVYYSLNETGTFVWNQISAPASTDEITSKALENYSGEFDDARVWIEALINDLADQGLIIEASTES